jgi:hypothetical protein
MEVQWKTGDWAAESSQTTTDLGGFKLFNSAV